MYKELKGVIVNKIAGGVVIGLPPGFRVEFKTKDTYKLGQVVWVAFNYTNNTVVSVCSTPGTSKPSHNNTPNPESFWSPTENEHPLVEAEECLEVEDETFPDTDAMEEY